MDHEAMRAAYLRALNHNRTDFTDVCHNCKLDYVPNSGDIVDLVTLDKIYKLWYCQTCTEQPEYV